MDATPLAFVLVEGIASLLRCPPYPCQTNRLHRLGPVMRAPRFIGRGTPARWTRSNCSQRPPNHPLQRLNHIWQQGQRTSAYHLLVLIAWMLPRISSSSVLRVEKIKICRYYVRKMRMIRAMGVRVRGAIGRRVWGLVLISVLPTLYRICPRLVGLVVHLLLEQRGPSIYQTLHLGQARLNQKQPRTPLPPNE